MWTTRSIDTALKKAVGKTDVWLTEPAPRGAGRLRFRACSSGHGIFYYRYVGTDGKQKQLRLGAYDAEGTAGLTLREARDKADGFSKLWQAGQRDLHAFVENQHAETAARHRQAKEAERKAAAGSLGALCGWYCDRLAAKGKQSAADVRGMLERHVLRIPLADKRAADIDRRDVLGLLNPLVEAGKGRTAAKLRAALASAYSMALDDEVAGFEVEFNPVLMVPAKRFAEYVNVPRHRSLSESELREFLRLLDVQPSLSADAIKLSLFCGGQRFLQLLRLTPANFNPDDDTITLFDPKGKRSQPRLHVLPLNKTALGIVQRLLQANGDKPFLFTYTGEKPLLAQTVSSHVTAISRKMVKAGTAREQFQLSDLRRTAETWLAKMGVSKETRARLLSHGISGVQDRNYNQYEYLDEKRAALAAWEAKLLAVVHGDEARPDNVVSFKRA